MLAGAALIAAACSSPSGSPAESDAAPSQAASEAAPSAAANEDTVVTFEGSLPEGWEQDGEGAIPIPPSEAVFFEVGQGFVVMSADCLPEPEPGVGDDAAAFTAALAERDGLEPAGQEDVTVDGLSGVQLDFSAAEDGTGATCIGEGDEIFVPLWVAADGGFAGAAPGDESRLIVLDKPAGGTLLIWITATEGESLAEYLDAAMTVVDGLRIEVP
jgi:hypothetical protein